MIKCEAIADFTLEKFNELKNITRKLLEEKSKLFKGDTFECDEKMADYLTGNNALNKVVVKVIEVMPEIDITETEFDIRSKEVKKLVDEALNKKEETLKQEKPKKTTKKKTSKK